ncbi:MAG: hypothetical protein O2887_04750 [Bacteroidetes bacterium]|nr:hypothetical protein [Bacteroidota bacterium]MDA1119793.1 hypothetical protein [Bacteroidota bacterium]
MARLILLMTLLAITGCENSTPINHVKSESKATEIEPDRATKEMIVKVRQAVSTIDVATVPYILNRKKADLLIKEYKLLQVFSEPLFRLVMVWS